MAQETNSQDSTDSSVTKHKHGGLSQLAATAICGNDITSSCLYVSALAILAAGRWAPLALLMVAGLLFLFRFIYAEVVGALPLNGGAYNALLNTTSKFRASIAACLTILSYMATAVLSANEAVHYLQFPFGGHWDYWVIIGTTTGLLAVFMVLSIIGITESAVVAIGIFITHLSSLLFLLIIGLIYIAMHGVGIFTDNMGTASPVGPAAAIFFGFSAALLGISGFESSANFVEEQAEGVFPKTLRNMWLAVSFFNPAMALLALAVIPMASINDQNKTSLLADIGEKVGGTWLANLIAIDAVLVLSGAVLTSFVGVTGLVHRMTLDRCLPQFLLKTNRRGTTHRIIIAFFILSVSVLLITQGELEALAGVYTLSFLAVMALFCVGSILLKIRRARLPRPTHAAWPVVLIAFAAVLVGLVGNTVMERPAKLFHISENGELEDETTITIRGNLDGKPISLTAPAGEPLAEFAESINQLTEATDVTAEFAGNSSGDGGGTLTFVTEKSGSAVELNIVVKTGSFEIVGGHEGTAKGGDGLSNLKVFLQYFIPAMLIIVIMLGRIAILKACLAIVRASISALLQPMTKTAASIHEKIEQINSQQVVFFTRGDDVANLNNAMIYIRQNENTNRMKIVTVVRDDSEVPEDLEQELKFLDNAYPEIDIEFVILHGKFGPELIEQLSEEWRIPKNFMFIGSPGDHFMYGLAELGGVRLII